jgi:hypothetical protein
MNRSQLLKNGAAMSAFGASHFFELPSPPGQKGPEGSMSHPFHGGFVGWFYQSVAGIEPGFAVYGLGAGAYAFRSPIAARSRPRNRH